jgi:NADP-dependent 3-hydroxy acid dehydrogenase YdfG
MRGTPVVATSPSIGPSDDHDLLAVQSDITEVGPAQRVVKQAVDRFGRIDTQIDAAGIFIGKPFTDYTLEDYEAIIP